MSHHERGALVLIEQRDAVRWLTINRVDKGNALNVAMQDQLIASLDEAANDEGVKAVVLTAAGTRSFCGGIDFSETGAESPLAMAQLRSRKMFQTCFAMIDCGKPVVATLNGHAVGAGCILALLADARLAAPQATLSLPEITRGQPTFAGAVVVSRALGDLAAADLVQSGRRMPASEALSRYLITGIHTDAELAEQAQVLALQLASPAPLAFALNKKWIQRRTRQLLEEASRESDAARASVLAARSKQ